MPKVYPLELRRRVVAHVEEGHSHRSTATHFKVSVKFVNDMVKLKRETGSLAPRAFPGQKGRGKLEPYKNWLKERIQTKGDITLDQLVLELHEQFDVTVHRWTVCRVLHQLGLSHKKRQFWHRSNTEVM